MPERFDLDGPVPNETNTDFRYSFHWNIYVFLLFWGHASLIIKGVGGKVPVSGVVLLKPITYSF